MPQNLPPKSCNVTAVRSVGMHLDTCDSDSHCCLVCDANARDAKSLAVWVAAMSSNEGQTFSSSGLDLGN